jgi:hypothetical protein
MDRARTNRHQLLLDLASAGESGILPPGSDHGRKHKKRRLSGSASARPRAATDSSGDETFAENQRHGSSEVGGFPLYLRKPRPSLISDALGSKTVLDPGCGLYEVDQELGILATLPNQHELHIGKTRLIWRAGGLADSPAVAEPASRVSRASSRHFH